MIFADSSYFIAMAREKDRWHKDALRLAEKNKETLMISELVMAKSLETTWEELFNTMHAHPTLSEAVMEAAGDSHGVALNM